MKKRFLVLALILSELTLAKQPKQWTVMIYIAADNDLEVFVNRNLKQMMRAGSNEHLNIITLVNMKGQKEQRKISKTLFIEKNTQKLLAQASKAGQTDSGDPETLINFCCDAIDRFPAEHYALFFWDHGTGVIDPFPLRRFATTEMFQFTPSNQVPNPGLNFFEETEEIATNKKPRKGVCFDDTTGSFLTEAKLQYALNEISTAKMGGRKFDIIGFDACLMAMVEIGSAVKNYAHLMVASQEVELGTGWDYKRIFLPFQEGRLAPIDFGKHIVDAYGKTYSFIDDFTLSCINLDLIPVLEKKVQKIFLLLQHGFSLPTQFVAELLHKSRFKYLCTHFEEPEYIDLGHFLENLLHNLNNVALSTDSATEIFKASLSASISEAVEVLNQAIVANIAGNFFPNATGISIYFPEHSVHRSYRHSYFASATNWFSLLTRYTS